MSLRLRRSASDSCSSDQPIEEWPFLDEQLLVPSRSLRVCMTCHWFRHYSGVNCIPLLTCQLHQGLIPQGAHLLSRCQGWTDDMVRRRGWAPEAG
ncbi:MAG: galactose oxidase [Cyanobium sp. CACIAM 14]|nr:MAG: galactose oxidase [Cyanobium sp. CACIAM 14]